MIDEVTMIENWYWPKKDTKCWPWLQNERDLPQLITNLCTTKGTMIQAGGNCGFYTSLYADMFQHVYTFEPDTLNFYCLTLNMKNRQNVYKNQCCLSDDHRLVSITGSKKNVGCYWVDTESKGNIPSILIDDLALEECSLIHLDVEGWEFPAIRGASNTLDRCKPVVALEWMDHGARFGYPEKDILDWLGSKGYVRYQDIMHERIFFPNI